VGKKRRLQINNKGFKGEVEVAIGMQMQKQRPE
jgi:hypothetical protein